LPFDSEVVNASSVTVGEDDNTMIVTNLVLATAPSNIGIEGNDTPVVAKPSSITDIGADLLASAKPTSTAVERTYPTAGIRASATTETDPSSAETSSGTTSLDIEIREALPSAVDTGS